MPTTWAWKTAFAALTVSCLTVVLACSEKLQKPRAFGREKEILVLCNDSTWSRIEAPLRARVEVEFHAVRREPIFTVAQVNQKRVDYFKEWDKIILIESLERMVLLPEVVDDSTMKKINAGQGLFFTQPDVWARGQRVVGLAAPKEEDLSRLVRLYGDRIFETFLRMLENEERERMFLSGINQVLADSLSRNFGFTMVLPKVYVRLLADSLPENQLLLIHADPVRSIFITWQDNPPPLEYSGEFLAAWRDSLLVHIFPGMYTLPERIDTSSVTANGIPRTRIYGVWEDREQISGGIFVSQIIEAPQWNRRYYIDCRLFSPDLRKNKYRFIYQFDNIMQSFDLTSKRDSP